MVVVDDERFYELFEYIDNALWVKCEKNPIDFLDKLTYSRILALEKTKYSRQDGLRCTRSSRIICGRKPMPKGRRSPISAWSTDCTVR